MLAHAGLDLIGGGEGEVRKFSGGGRALAGPELMAGVVVLRFLQVCSRTAEMDLIGGGEGEVRKFSGGGRLKAGPRQARNYRSCFAN